MNRRLFALPAIAAASMFVATAVHAAGKVPSTRFDMFPNAKFTACASADAKYPATASARVERGRVNDVLDLKLEGFKPDLDFDLFTVERSPQLANGTADPAFGGNFGLAWYQSDIHVNHEGEAHVRVKTILLDQIFGFDAGKGLAPTNTFHLGFWFNNPADAASCGFTGVTPFNGEHQAGPLAFISRPVAATNLGPLCTDPTTSTSGTTTCNP